MFTFNVRYKKNGSLRTAWIEADGFRQALEALESEHQDAVLISIGIEADV